MQDDASILRVEEWAKQETSMKQSSAALYPVTLRMHTLLTHVAYRPVVLFPQI
jgi:hypothetical protein